MIERKKLSFSKKVGGLSPPQPPPAPPGLRSHTNFPGASIFSSNRYSFSRKPCLVLEHIQISRRPLCLEHIGIFQEGTPSRTDILLIGLGGCFRTLLVPDIHHGLALFSQEILIEETKNSCSIPLSTHIIKFSQRVFLTTGAKKFYYFPYFHLRVILIF